MWTHYTMTVSVRHWHEQHGRWPVTHDFETDRSLPSRRTVTEHGLTLAALRRAAGAEDGGAEGWGGNRHGGGWPKGKPRVQGVKRGWPKGKPRRPVTVDDPEPYTIPGSVRDRPPATTHDED